MYVSVSVFAGAATSCSELYTRGLEDNAFVTIDPDGSRSGRPFTAYCQRNGTTAYTIIRTSNAFFHVLSMLLTDWRPSHRGIMRVLGLPV